MKNSNKSRDIIIKTAKQLFERYGFNKTSIDDIAHHSHKAKGSIYYNFGGKIELFKIVVEQELQHIKDELTLIVKNHSITKSGPEQLIEYMMRRMELFNNALVYRQILSQPYQRQDYEATDVANIIREPFDKWERTYFQYICEEGIKRQVLESSANPEAFSDMLCMILKGLEYQFFSKGDYEKSKETFEYFVESLIRNMVKNRKNK